MNNDKYIVLIDVINEFDSNGIQTVKTFIIPEESNIGNGRVFTINNEEYISELGKKVKPTVTDMCEYILECVTRYSVSEIIVNRDLGGMYLNTLIELNNILKLKIPIIRYLVIDQFDRLHNLLSKENDNKTEV